MQNYLRIISIILALAGIGISIYLTWVHYSDVNPVCTSGTSCIKVQNSDYADVQGIPVALLGIIGYSLILISLIIKHKYSIMVTIFLTTIGVGFSLYLTYLELFVINAICEWCVISAIIMIILFILSWIRAFREPALMD